MKEILFASTTQIAAAIGAGDVSAGVQIVGKRWDASRLLGVAQALTSITGGARRPPGY